MMRGGILNELGNLVQIITLRRFQNAGHRRWLSSAALPA